MKKIGFIDYYLDEWHANNYPAMIRKTPAAVQAGLEVCYAYAAIDSPWGGLTTDEWCKKQGIARVGSIEELVKLSDCIVVLSPDNPEQHEKLAEVALCSGKPVYVDKTFAPDRAAAERMFSLAARHSTPMYSTSALRFADEVAPFRAAAEGAGSCIAMGPNSFEIYAVHIFEILTSVMKGGARRMMCTSAGLNRVIAVEYEGGRTGTFVQMDTGSAPFIFSAVGQKGEKACSVIGDTYFERFIENLVQFFTDGIPRVPARETIEMMSLLEAARKALASPFTWVEVARG